MDLSIIIVNFNTKDLVNDCLASIEKYIGEIKAEVIVVDNGSWDDSVLFLDKYKTNKFNYKLIKNKKNEGYAKANNQGLKRSTGKHKLLLNSDTVVKKNTLINLVTFANVIEDAGVVGSKLYNADGTIQSSVFNFPTIRNAINQYWLGKGRRMDKYYPKIDSYLEVDAVVGASFLITQRGFQKVGLLDESYFMFYEDLDYCRKITKSGLKVYYLATSKVIHHHGASGIKLAGDNDQWRRLIPSSKIYHGLIKHYLISFILWSGQKFLGKH